MIVIVMVASCIVLVGISYIILDILSGIVIVPKTDVEEVFGEGELLIPLVEAEIRSLQVSGDGSYLAFIAERSSDRSATLRVFELEGGPREVHMQDIEGSELAWLGYSQSLVFEDRGDIYRLDLTQGTSDNLTASSAYDSDPLPSPDGRYILWTVDAEDPEGEGPGFWVMADDGSGKAFLAEKQDLAVWDPAGGMVISLRDDAGTGGEAANSCQLQTAAVGGAGWEDYALCDSEVRYIWWPAQDTVLCVGPESVKGEDVIKGVWIRVRRPEKIRKVASTEGLGQEEIYYVFYPSRTDQRVAYVGRKGLECFDYDARLIRRYPDLGARPPLAWNEIQGEVFFWGPEGIYSVNLEEK